MDNVTYYQSTHMLVLLYRIICYEALTLPLSCHHHSTTPNSVNFVAKKFEGKDTRLLLPDTASKKKAVWLCNTRNYYELMTGPK